MSNDLEIAKRLAAITGKPLSDFYKGEIGGVSRNNGADIQEGDDASIEALGADAEYEDIPKQQASPEVVELQRLFKDSSITNNKILGGRTMTRKEYLQYTKGLMREDVNNHPLIHKMFRSEGQSEAFFTKWLDRFPEPELEEEDE